MKKIMDINKETAIRLWVQQFGKRQKAIDFPGARLQKRPTMTGTANMVGMLTTFCRYQEAAKRQTIT